MDVMKKFLGITLAIAFSATVATATDLNISVESAGLNTVTVAPGEVVNYTIVGELSDALNGGLALWACDLAFTGGDLSQGTAGAGMGDFVRNAGINNPAGYGGTTTVAGRDGELVQAGGGMNTILNFAGNADFPIGVVTELIAHPGSPEVLMTGSLTAPAGLGEYTLTASNCFGNVIKDGETGVPFWATQPFGVGTVTNLTVTVDEDCAQVASLDFAALAATEYPCGTSLSREGGNILRFEFDIPVSAPGPGDIEVRELLDGGLFGPDIAPLLTITVENGNVLTITEAGQVFTNGTWYGVTNSGLWCDAGNFQVDYAVVYGDANGTFFTSATDLSAVRANFADLGVTPDNSRYDINKVGGITATDLSAARADFSDLLIKPTGHGCSP